MDTIKSQFFQWFLANVAPVLFTGVGALLMRFIHVVTVHKQAEAAAATAHGDALNRDRTLAGVIHLVEMAFQRVLASTGPLVQQALADGKIDDAEKKKIEDATIDALKTLLSPDVRDEIVSELGITPDAIEHYLASLVLARINGAKQGGGALGFLRLVLPQIAASEAPPPAVN